MRGSLGDPKRETDPKRREKEIEKKQENKIGRTLFWGER